MELTGEQLIPAPRDKVWAAINDPEILRQCITGAETVTLAPSNPFVDPANCHAETEIQEAMYRAALEEQRGGRP